LAPSPFSRKEKDRLSSGALGEISLAYLPPTPWQTSSALAGATVLFFGLAALAPFAAKPLPHVNGFIPALDAITFVTDFITAGLLLAHFSIAHSRALLALACGYLFSALVVVAHGLSFPGAFVPTGNFGGSSQATVRLYLIGHLGFPIALFTYVWLKDEDQARSGAPASTALLAISSVTGVLVFVSCIAWLAAAGDELLPSVLVDPERSSPIISWVIEWTMLLSATALAVLWARQRSALDQWLMVVVLASIVELAITALFGGTRFTLGFYTGRAFSLVTSTLVLTALLAETTRLYARVARANMLADVIKASQTLSGEIESAKLIDRLMVIALQHADVDRGLLILQAGDEYLIMAEARATGGRVEVEMRHEPITESTCPESLVRYLARTMKSLILNDASKVSPFPAGDYLRYRKSKSILCIPVIKQGKLTGILLIEDALTSHPFTPAQIGLLELVAAQAAISLENTRLYSDLKEREEKIRRLVDSNIIGICVYDLDRRILEANDAFLGMVGYSRDDVISGHLSFASLTPPEWAEDDARRLADLAATGIWRPSEKEFFRKDGSRVPVFLGSAIFGEGRHQGVAFIVDMTERKQAEAALREAERRNVDAQMQLAHANRIATMGHIAASLAHEINQPVGAALMNAETAARWLRRQPPNLVEANQSIDQSITAGKRAVEIIGRTRDFSKNRPGLRKTLEINLTILEVLGLVRAAISDNRVSAKTQLSGGLPLVSGDRVQLQQVIMNLIMNAVEAMREITEGSRELLISTSAAEPDGVLVKVKDSGPGLPSANPELIFDAFYTTKADGLGMGLSICRSIVEAHGGQLWATPNEPRGAVFCMTLPVGDKSPE
jgi:PAS domain S-box-containing protein